MSDTIPDDIGRNDPCPCGSGRKYKKCCQRAHELEKQTEKRGRSPEELVDADTIPWKFFEILGQIQDNGAIGLFYDLAHDQGPFRAKYPAKSDFVGAVDTGEDQLPGGPSFDLAHMRVDGADTWLLIREDDPKPDEVTFQLVALRGNELDADGENRDVDHPGYRIWDYQTHRLDRDDFDGVPSMQDFGIEWDSSVD